MLFRLSPVVPGRVRSVEITQPAPPDRADVLPAAVGRFTRRFVYSDTDRHLSFEQGGGHHGSHPHLVHEFVRSIVEGRSPEDPPSGKTHPSRKPHRPCGRRSG